MVSAPPPPPPGGDTDDYSELPKDRSTIVESVDVALIEPLDWEDSQLSRAALGDLLAWTSERSSLTRS